MQIKEELAGDKIKRCSICGGPVSFVTNDVLYGGSVGDWPYIYLCDDLKCAAYVGCHNGTDNPFGTMADAQTRRARQAAHAVFDQLWKKRIMKRKDAYLWLSKEIDIPYNKCHIGMFNIAQCELVIQAMSRCEFLKGERDG